MTKEQKNVIKLYTDNFGTKDEALRRIHDGNYDFYPGMSVHDIFAEWIRNGIFDIDTIVNCMDYDKLYNHVYTTGSYGRVCEDDKHAAVFY